MRAWRLALIAALVAALAGTPGAVPRRLELGAITSVPDFFLRGIVQVVTSGDGAHVYAISAADDAVSVFRRDAGAGFLHFVEAERDGVGDVDGLDGPRGIAISPDGAHVYVAAGDDLVVFGRNATTGELSFIAAISNGPGVGFGLSRPDAPVVSPDGAHLYVAGLQSLAVFERDAGSGMLTLVEVEFDGVGGVDGIGDARSIAMSPDGAHVYVTGFADDAVAVFARDPASGAVTFVDLVGDLDSAWPVVVSPDGAHLYVAGRGSIVAFARDAATGALSVIGAWETAAAARGLALSGDGAHVYLSQEDAGRILAFARDSVTGTLTPLDHQGIFGQASVTPDGAHVLVAFAEFITVLDRDPGSGALTVVTPVFTIPFLARISVAPDGAHVYAAYFSQLAIFARDPSTGVLGFVDVQPNAGAPTVSPEGAHVYTLEGYAIGVYARNPATGALTLVEREPSTLLLDGGLVLSPDGATVYATALEDDSVLVFGRDPATGALTLVEAEDVGLASGVGMNVPGALAVSPDGAHVYVGSFTEMLIATFARDAATGALAFLGVLGAGPGGLDVFAPIDDGGLAVSPDGAWVYAATGGGGFEYGTVSVLARHPGTGVLAFVETEREGERGVSHVGGALAVSPDGELLLMSEVGSAVVAGGPDLAFVEGREGFLAPGEFVGYDPAFSPDGRHAYRAGYSDTVLGSVALLTRGFAGCASGVLPGCRSAGRGTLLMRAEGGIVWRWRRGAETTFDALGDPTATTDYALCVYDESGPTSALLLRALMPAAGDCVAGPGRCWSVARDGYRYRDPNGTPEGLVDLALMSGPDGVARIALRGGREHLAMPTLPLGLPVRVQLESSTGECWEAVYNEPRRNDATRFVASPD